MTGKGPWVVIDLMTGEYIERCDSEIDALKKCIGKAYDVQYRPGRKK